MLQYEVEKLTSDLKRVIGKQYEDIILNRVSLYAGMDTKMAFRQIILDLFKIFGNNLNIFYKKLEELESVTINQKTVSGNELKEKFKEWIGDSPKGNSTIEDNHKRIIKVLPWILNEFEINNVDYFLAGALACYLLLGEMSPRYHDDIDILLNEKDILKVKKIFEKSEFDFYDLRNNSPKRLQSAGMPTGAHEVVAKDKYSEFHLGFFCFERGLNNEVITKEYFVQETKEGKKITKVFKRVPSVLRSHLCYPDDIHYLPSGEPFKMTSIESIYMIKQFTQNKLGREKDAIDICLMENSGKLDKTKLDMLKNCENCKIVIETCK